MAIQTWAPCLPRWRVFIPYSTISLSLYGQKGVGNATVEILATPVMCGEVPQGNAHLYGLTNFSAAPSEKYRGNRSDECQHVSVARSETDSTPWKIEAIGLTNQVFWSWTWDANSVQSGNCHAHPLARMPAAGQYGQW